MGIIDVVRKWNEKKKEKSQKFKEMQEDDRLQTMLNERKKSSNQRELEKYYKDQQEEKIKNELGRIHHKQTSESWKSNIFNNSKSILTEDRPILKEPNIFMNNPNHFLQRGNLF